MIGWLLGVGTGLILFPFIVGALARRLRTTSERYGHAPRRPVDPTQCGCLLCQGKAVRVEHVGGPMDGFSFLLPMEGVIRLPGEGEVLDVLNGVTRERHYVHYTDDPRLVNLMHESVWQ